MLLIFLLFLTNFSARNYAAKIPKCVAATYTVKLKPCSNLNQIVFENSFDFKLDSNYAGNSSFPNKVTFSNYTFSSLNSTLYFRDTPVGFYYNSQKMISQWEPKSETMHVSNFPNGDVDFWFSVRIFDYDGSFTASDAATSPFFDNGTVFHAYSGKLLLPDDKCYESEDDGYCSVTNYAMYSSVCCKEFEYNDIPNYQKDICEEYESKSRISDENGIFATMDVLFEVALGGLNTKAVNFTSVTSDNYILGSFYAGQMCEGNKTYVDYSDPRCHFKFLSKNTQLNIGFILQYNETIIAKLIRQNGMFFKEDYTTFTPSNPCWTEFSAIPFGIGKIANNSFCCTKFKGQIFTTPSSTTKSKTATFATTTISQIPSGSCALYNSTTKVLDNSAYLEVEYKLNTTTLTVNIIGYFALSDSVVQLEAYNDLTFTQSCRANTSSPTNICYFRLSDNNKYELEMRTSKMPDGFNMLQIIEQKGQLIVPKLSPATPCYLENNPYKYGNSSLYAKTQFCCSDFI